LDEFKQAMQKRSLYIPFADVGDFAEKLRDQLDIVMNRLDRSEEKKELWSKHAVLTELGKLQVGKAQHDFEMQKRRTQLLHDMTDQAYRR
jgi:hypothetical protein